MKIRTSCFALLLVLASFANAGAQSSEHKWEAGGHFSTLAIEDPLTSGLAPPRTEAGFGGRLGYNFSRYFALEAQLNFYPRDYRFDRSPNTGGRILQGLFGAKAGFHVKRFGFFGKARAGFQTSYAAAVATFPNGDGPNPRDRFGFETIQATQFTVDVGGVAEYYPTRRTLIRIDVSDMITPYDELPFVCFPSGTPCPVRPVSHTLGTSVGFGFRF